VRDHGVTGRTPQDRPAQADLPRLEGRSGIGVGVAAASVPDRGNPRDNAVAACSGDDDNILVDDDGPGGTTTCYQHGITTTCDASDCVIITDDPRLSHRTNGSGAQTAHSQF
jgi:hypothetical protein